MKNTHCGAVLLAVIAMTLPSGSSDAASETGSGFPAANVPTALKCAGASDSATPTMYSATATSIRLGVFYRFAVERFGEPVSCRWSDKERHLELQFAQGVTLTEGVKPPDSLQEYDRFGDSLSGVTLEAAEANRLLREAAGDWFESGTQARDSTDPNQQLLERAGCLAIATKAPNKDGKIVSVSFQADNNFQCWPARYKENARTLEHADDCKKHLSPPLYEYAERSFGKHLGCVATGSDQDVHTEWRFPAGVALLDRGISKSASSSSRLSGISISEQEATPVLRVLCLGCQWDKPERRDALERPEEERVSFFETSRGGALMILKNGRVIELRSGSVY